MWHRAHGLEKRNSLWYKGTALVVVGNNDLRRGVISLFHDPPTAGHPGIAKTTTLLNEYYWWPGMRDTVTQYIKGCAQCQMTKSNTTPIKPPLQPITPEFTLLFETVAMCHRLDLSGTKTVAVTLLTDALEMKRHH